MHNARHTLHTANDRANDLDRQLGFTEALSIVIGRIIGSGIFRTPGPIMMAVSGMEVGRSYTMEDIPIAHLSVGLFFAAWILGGLISFLGALCYGELVSMLPRSGGPYVYLKAAYPEVWTFLRGWTMFFVSETAAIAAVALVCSEYGGYLMEHFYGQAPSPLVEGAIALAILWLLTFANSFGVALSGSMQNLLSILKAVALLSMVYFSLFHGNGDLAHFTEHGWPDKWGWATMIGLGQAMRYAFFAYSGWEGATYVAEEVRRPERNLPLSLFLGIGVVTVLYFMVNAGYIFQLSSPEMVLARKRIAAVTMESAIGASGSLLLAAFVVLSTFGNVSTQILVKARTWHAMARDNLFFSPLARLHPRYHTPNRALYAQGGWATILLLFAVTSANAYETLIDFFSFASALFNTSTFVAVLLLRRKMPAAKRPFRLPFLFPIASVVILFYVWFMLVTLYDRPLHSLAGIALILSGLIYYQIKKRNKTAMKSSKE